MMRFPAIVALLWSPLLLAQETEWVSVTSVNSSPYVCTVDGVEQQGTHTATHTASARVANLQMSHPDAVVECSRQEVLRGSVSSEFRDLLAGTAPEPEPEPDSPAPSPGEDPAWIYVQEPTHNKDGSLLTDLTTVRIAYSVNESGPFAVIADLDAPLTGPTEIDGLPEGAVYFIAYAINSKGASSDASNIVSRVLQ